jgi:protein phosphatase
MGLIKRLFQFSGEKAITDEYDDNIAGMTSPGRIRELNEDAFIIQAQKSLFVISDGMGGHRAGEIASKKAVKVINSFFSPKRLAQIKGNDKKTRNALISSVQDAHINIREMGEVFEEYQGMGCTVVVALLEEDSLHLCHVGDSRAYVLSDQRLKLLTEDHSYVMELVKQGNMTMEEARQASIKNELCQAVGASKTIVPTYNIHQLNIGDKILLCSDGLWDMVPDQQIEDILKKKKNAVNLCKELLKAANQAGGIDNVTVVVIIH